VALESLFDHIEVEDDSGEDFPSAPRVPSPARTSAEQQQRSSAHHQPSPPSSRAFPQNTAPARYG